jgi:hypothetical protein
MRSLMAIVAGSAFIIVAVLLLQLAYIFIAVAYNALAVDFPLLNEIAGLFRYLIGIPVLIATVFAGGYITASVANMHANVKVWFHGLSVGCITVGAMMYSALGNHSSLTLTGIIVTLLALSASPAGGFYWLRRAKQAESLAIP